MTQDYEQGLRAAIFENKPQEIESKVAQFQSKVQKTLEIRIAAEGGIERLQKELAKCTASRTACDDLIKLATVLQSREALAKLQAALPDHVVQLEGEALNRVRKLVNANVDAKDAAMPFAVMLVMKRLKQPSQIIDLAIDMAGSRKVASFAASPAAVIAAMALDHLDGRRQALCQAMNNNRLTVAASILAEIYRIEHMLRRRLVLSDESEWGRRLDAIMRQVTDDVIVEANRIPDDLDHVLLAALRRHNSLTRRIKFGILQARDAFSDRRVKDAAASFARALSSSRVSSAASS